MKRLLKHPITIAACAITMSCTIGATNIAAQEATTQHPGAVAAPIESAMRNGILVVTPSMAAGQVEAAMKNKNTLLYFGEQEMFEGERAALEKVASDNKDLLVVFVDPLKLPGIDKVVASLVQGPVVYPTHIFVGFPYPVILPVKGKMTPEQIAQMLAELHDRQKKKAPPSQP